MSRSERVTIQEQVRKLMSEHAPGATVNEKEEFLHGEVSVLRAPDRANPKAVRVARAIGKDETNKGPIAQARKDGYEVGLDDCRQALTNAKLD